MIKNVAEFYHIYIFFREIEIKKVKQVMNDLLLFLLKLKILTKEVIKDENDDKRKQKTI